MEPARGPLRTRPQAGALPRWLLRAGSLGVDPRSLCAGCEGNGRNRQRRSAWRSRGRNDAELSGPTRTMRMVRVDV
jgi:hypothetical protein